MYQLVFLSCFVSFVSFFVYGIVCTTMHTVFLTLPHLQALSHTLSHTLPPSPSLFLSSILFLSFRNLFFFFQWWNWRWSFFFLFPYGLDAENVCPLPNLCFALSSCLDLLFVPLVAELAEDTSRFTPFPVNLKFKLTLGGTPKPKPELKLQKE